VGEIADALRRAQLQREPGPTPAEPGRELPDFRAPRAPAAAPVAPPPPAAAPRSREAQVRIATGKDQARWAAHAVRDESCHFAAEQFHHFALRLQRELAARKGRSIAITSCVRDEGKTFTACNLALSFDSMAAGRRVALLDLDLRGPKIGAGLGVRAQVGMERVLTGEQPLAAACLATDLPALDLYLVSSAARDAHGILASPRLPVIFRQLESQYDLVIVDTPPLLLLPDSALLAEHVAGCVAVVRSGLTRRGMLRQMLTRLPPGKLMGVFVNYARVPQYAKYYGSYLEEAEPSADAASRASRA
jgi:Mrp family chromosome partitioning ATPase